MLSYTQSYAANVVVTADPDSVMLHNTCNLPDQLADAHVVEFVNSTLILVKTDSAHTWSNLDKL